MNSNIPHVTLSKKIAYHLREQVSIGNFPAGSKLPTEKELGKRFHASRVSVREALAVLAAEGLVTTIRGKGSFVNSHEESNRLSQHTADLFENVMQRLQEKPMSILSIMELREILECAMVGLAAVRATPEDILELKLALNQYISDSEEHKETVDSDLALHYNISKASRNEFLWDLLGRLQQIIKHIILSKRKQPKSQEEFDKEVAEHKLIIQAIERHDPEAAKTAMKAHLERSHKIAETVMMQQL